MIIYLLFFFSVQNNEDSSCKSTRSVDLELMPASVENKTSALDEDIEEYSNKNKKLTALDRKNSQELQNRNDVLLDSNEAEEDQGLVVCFQCAFSDILTFPFYIS